MWGVRVLLSFVAAELLGLHLYLVWGVFVLDWIVRAGAFAWRYRRRDLHGVAV
jgi:Na+-driven multidrug efflux pump